MKIPIVEILFVAAIICFHESSANKITAGIKYNSDTLPGSILIINSFDAMSINARNNKRELFARLTDSLKTWLAKKIKEQTGHETIVIPGILQGNTDSLIYSLISENKSTKAILIRSLEAYFEETSEKESTDSEGRAIIVTSYDLCAKNEYSLFEKYRIINPMQSAITNCEFFTTRSVKDRNFVIRVGPDIVGKKKHTFGIVAKNAEKYVSEISVRLLVNN